MNLSISLSKALRHQRQLIDRLMGSGEGIVDSEDVIGVPCAERFLVSDAGAFTNDLRRLALRYYYSSISTSRVITN